MKRSLLTVLLFLGSAYTLAACPPHMLTCANASQAFAANKAEADKPAYLMLKSGNFALERTDLGDNKIDIRPSWQIDDNTRLSLKAGKKKVELRLKVQW